MRTVRVKILFTIFIFLATVPFVTQAMGGEALKAGNNMLKWAGRNAKNYFLKKPSNLIVVAGGSLCLYSSWQLSKIISSSYKLYNEVNDCRRELLAKVGTGELIENPLGEKYCLTLPESSLVEKVHDTLKYLDIEDFFIRRILILGKECKEGNPNKRYFLEEIKFTNDACFPYAILIDNTFLAEGSSIGKEFIYLRGGGYFKAWLGRFFDRELVEVTADIFALNALIRQKKKDQLRGLYLDVFIGSRPRPYLSLRELVCYGEKIFDIQQRGDKLDALSYAQKIVDERKSDGYKQNIVEKTNRYFELSGVTRGEVDRLEKVADGLERELLAKDADDRGRELLAKVDTQELLDEVLSGKETKKTEFPPRQYYIVSLDSKFVREARDVLKFLNIPDSLAEKIPILGKKFIGCSGLEAIAMGQVVNLGQVVALSRGSSKAPCAIFINTELSPLLKKFIFYHEAWHVKSFSSESDSDLEVEEVAADICALDSFIRWEGKDQFQSVVSDPLMANNRQDPYLSCQELVYHGEKIFDIQQRGSNLDPLTYAQEVVADRKKDGYGQKIMKETNGYFGLFDATSLEVDALKKKAGRWGRELLAKVDTQELLSNDDLLFKRVKNTDPSLRQFQLTSLEKEFVKEIRDALRFINDSNSLVEKIPILGIKCGVDYSGRKEPGTIDILALPGRFISVPYVVLIDGRTVITKSLLFNLFRNGWMVKSGYECLHQSDSELNGVAADTCALDAFIRQKKKNQIKSVACDPFMRDRSKNCLSSQELVYHGEQLFAAQEKENKLDVLTYARKIVAERKEDGYKERVAQEARRICQSGKQSTIILVDCEKEEFGIKFLMDEQKI